VHKCSDGFFGPALVSELLVPERDRRFEPGCATSWQQCGDETNRDGQQTDDCRLNVRDVEIEKPPNQVREGRLNLQRTQGQSRYSRKKKAEDSQQ
jgi:hypothetical protein